MSFDKETQLKEIKEIYADAARDEGWDVEGEMLYSYYFVDESIEKLEKLGLQLDLRSYRNISKCRRHSHKTVSAQLNRVGGPYTFLLICHISTTHPFNSRGSFGCFALYSFISALLAHRVPWNFSNEILCARLERTVKSALTIPFTGCAALRPASEAMYFCLCTVNP